MKILIRDRPFNLKGGLWFFVSFRIFFPDKELEYLLFMSLKARTFFPEFNIRLYDKNSESHYFFFLHQNQNIFFSNIGNQNIFLEKNHNPLLQVKWSFLKYIDKNEILNCIKKLKCNKVSGEDYITNEYIKATATQFINIYEKLFNVIFYTGIIPDIWLIGSIKPIFKNKELNMTQTIFDQ